MTLEKLGITEEKFESQLAGGCFTYDTPVLTSDGQKPIGEIKIGDAVWSKDQITGEVSLKPVKNIYVHQVNSLLNLWVRGQKLTTTKNHIFYVSGKGWIEAGQIVAKDKVMMKDGSLEEVTKTENVELTEAVNVYNFEVADWHTYFVGEGILVHNESINPCGKTIANVLSGEILNSLPEDLYAFGNKTQPRNARAIQDFGVENGSDIVGTSLTEIKGASTFADINKAPLTGQYHKLPSGTKLPDGLGVVSDGVDVNPMSGHTETHFTICPTRPMTVDEFNRLYQSLPWEYGGKK